MKKLLQTFGIDFGVHELNSSGWPAQSVDAFISQFGGLSFGGGIYRVATAAIASSLEKSLAHEQSHRVFGYDWLGRVFALREGSDQGSVLLFEVGAGEILEIPATLEALHDVELVEFANDSLALPFFRQWSSANPESRLKTSQCVGYRVPLFLGGADSIENLEIADLDVYVSMCVQLKEGTRKN